MRTRLVMTVLSATALLAGSVHALDASAAPPPPRCAITDVGPREIVIGQRGSKSVRFEPVTNCPSAEDLNWYLTIRKGPQPYGFVLLANFWQPPSSRYRYDPEGIADVSPPNAYAGRNEIHVQGFYGEETGVPGDYLYLSSTVVLKRATTFEGHPDPGNLFNAEPETPARGGTLTFTGRLSRVNWDAGEFEPQDEPFAATVVLQFRPDGATAYRNVKLVRTAADGSVTTTEPARQSGTWRFRYLGDAVSGASKSREDYVAVP